MRALVLTSRSRLVAVPIEHVIETFRPLPVLPVAGAPTFVQGLAVVRGVPSPVVDLDALLGSKETAPASRFVGVRSGGLTLVLAARGVAGVRSLPESVLEDVPRLLDRAATETVDRIGTLDGGLLLLLKASRILDESAWDALGAAGNWP